MRTFGSARNAKEKIRKQNPSLQISGSVELRLDGELNFGCSVVISERTKLIVPHLSQLSIGNSVYVGRDSELGSGALLRLGQRASLQDRRTIVGDVDIGAYSILSLRVLTSSGQYYYSYKPHVLLHDQDREILYGIEGLISHSKPVNIVENCWLGAKVVVMPEVKIGKGAVVGAKSVVVDDLTPYSKVTGLPARVVGKRLDFISPSHIFWTSELCSPYFYSGFDLPKDQREINAKIGGLVSHQSFEIWLEHQNSRLKLRVKGLGPGPSKLSYRDFFWEIFPFTWVGIEVDHIPRVACFELFGPAVAVEKAWIT
jgi:acetyltransferase-like isoleucine patch superfamily enzyme